GFAFTVNVGSVAEGQAISAALAAASPAGGTITIAGVTYTWANFEALYNLLVFNTNEPVVITITVNRRLNASDAAAPVAVYCAADAVEVWTVGVDGSGGSNAVGSFGFSVSSADVNAGTSVSASGVTFESTAGGSFSVSATAHDGKPYIFAGSCS
ncbi:MAG: hypothetical protein IAE80_29140, partial [Anaerolinea sp.]|nr:hypothetical protein [Anaerolinea sp.]